MPALRASPRPQSLTELLLEVGPLWARDIRTAGDCIKAAYLPWLAVAPKEGVHCTRNLPYGPHARQVLDIYRPQCAQRAPVVLFLHGGAFVRGDKDINAEMYGNVLTWFARHGYVGVNVEYRLAPEAPYPGAVHDVAQALDWVVKHIGSYGGHPAQLALVGHSAGGTHAASYVCDPALGYLGRHLRCAVLVSARLRADQLDCNPNAAGVRAYFGDDDALLAQHSPVTHAQHATVPMFIVNAEYENPLLDVYGLEMAYRLAQHQGHAPRYLWLPEHNHVSIMAHFNTAEQFLGEQILDFFARV